MLDYQSMADVFEVDVFDPNDLKSEKTKNIYNEVKEQASGNDSTFYNFLKELYKAYDPFISDEKLLNIDLAQLVNRTILPLLYFID